MNVENRPHIGIGKKVLAGIDLAFSKITDSDYKNLRLNGKPEHTLHIRGPIGDHMVGVKRPDGTIVMTSARRSIMHDFDENGHLIARYRVAKPPKGYIFLNNAELQELFLRELGGY
jgi:hypothetical protein